MPQVERSIVVDVPPEALLAVIEDFEHYPAFLPEVRSITVANRTPVSAEVTYEIEVIKRIRYTIRVETIRADGRIEVPWRLLKGDLFKKNEGRWVLEPEGEDRTRATYALEVAFGGFIPVPAAIVDRLTAQSLPALLENFKKRAESLARTG